jgi:creatinine amidohydrolase
MNGHFENVAFLTEAIDLFLRHSSRSKVLLVSWWDQVSDELIEEIFAGAGFPGWDTEHAGITETALMQYFAPELVREDKIIDDQSERKPTYSIFPAPDNIIPKSGVLYKATYASREKGEKLANFVTDRIAQIARDELG